MIYKYVENIIWWPVWQICRTDSDGDKVIDYMCQGKYFNVVKPWGHNDLVIITAGGKVGTVNKSILAYSDLIK